MQPKIFQIDNEKDLITLATIDAECNKTPWSLENYKTSFNNKNNKILVLKNSKLEFVGCCVISINIDEIEILQLWVSKDHQKKGYASYILEELVKICKQYSYKQIFLEVLTSNLPAINLYHKSKFNQIGIRKNYYLINNKRYDGFIMAREII